MAHLNRAETLGSRLYRKDDVGHQRTLRSRLPKSLHQANSLSTGLSKAIRDQMLVCAILRPGDSVRSTARCKGDDMGHAVVELRHARTLTEDVRKDKASTLAVHRDFPSCARDAPLKWVEVGPRIKNCKMVTGV
jgi:hypothetical protein